MKSVPYSFQIRGVRAMCRMGGKVLNADEAGLGKSIESLMYMERNSPGVWPAVVVCPAGLKWNWEREALTHMGWKVEVLEGTGARKIRSRKRIFVINYDILKHWVGALQELRPGLVVGDEVQMVSNWQCQRARAFRRLCKDVKHLLMLSGTPLTNKPAELWHVLHILRPEQFPNFYSYASRWCALKRTPFGLDYSGASDLPGLHRTISPFMVRRLKEDVLRDLPEKTRCVVPLEMKGRKEYDKAVRDFLGWLGQKKPSALSGAVRAEFLVKTHYLKHLAAQLKLPAVLEWVDNFLAGCDRKLVAFAWHKDIVGEIARKNKHRAVVVSGQVTGQSRQTAVDRFQNEKSVRIFVGNIKAAGTGITLTAASDVVFAELAWTPGDMEQCESRPHRIGQHNSVSCWYLCARNSIEEKLLRIIQSKKRILSGVLDGDEGAGSMDVYDELIKALKEV